MLIFHSHWLPFASAIIFSIFSCKLLAEKLLPNAAKIEEYDDPLLDEIFADTNSEQKTRSASAVLDQSNHLVKTSISEHLERMDPASPSLPKPAIAEGAKNVLDPNAKPAAGSVFSNPGMTNFPTGLVGRLNGLSDPMGINGAGLAQSQMPGLGAFGSPDSALARPFTDLAFQAGQTFYTGVRQAGRLLGIDAGQYQPYEVPLISQGARFFGRRRRK